MNSIVSLQLLLVGRCCLGAFIEVTSDIWRFGTKESPEIVAVLQINEKLIEA